MKPVTLDVEDQAKIAKVGLEMKLLTTEVDAEAEKWDEYSENDIVKRAKNMTSMAYNMYLFTRGDGPLKTTHDLFTQAEFFAEEANKMYKTVREFSYEVKQSTTLFLSKVLLASLSDRMKFNILYSAFLSKSPDKDCIPMRRSFKSAKFIEHCSSSIYCLVDNAGAQKFHVWKF